MSAVVGGFVVPHVPAMLVLPELPSAEVREAVHEAYAEAARRLARLSPTRVIVVGADHYILFGPRCLPQMTIGTGEVDGPVERLPGLTRGRYATDESFAEHLRAHSAAEGFDWAVARSLTVDHAIALPYELLVRPQGEVPLVPIYLASGVEPYIPMGRAIALGSAVGRAVAAHDGDERVVIIGSGGISHSVGTDRMGTVNADFDHRVLDLIVAGDLAGLAALTDDDILAEAGNGGLEVRNLAFAAAAVGGTADVIAYAAVTEWATGMGFAELHPDRRAAA